MLKLEFKTLKNYFYIIILIAVLILLFLSFKNNFFTDSSYKTLKYIEEFKVKNSFDYYENSFNNIIVEKTFFYETIIGFLHKFLSLKIIHLFLLLFFSSSLYLIYIISFKISESKTAAVLSLILYSTSITFYASIFSLESFLISTPIILLFFYFIITKNFDWKKTFFLSILLSLLDFKSFFVIYVLSFSYFIFLSKSENTNSKISELNFILILTTIFFITITFRENLQLLGLKVLFENLPLQLFLKILDAKNILLRLYSSSIILLLLGVLGIIIAYTKKIEKSYIIISSFFISLFLVLITNNYFYILFLAISSSILASFSYNYFLQFLNLSKFKTYKKFLSFTIILLVLSLNLTQTFSDFNFYKKEFYISKEKFEVYNIIKEKTSYNSYDYDFKIFCLLKDSYKTEYFTKKSVFINYDFNYVDTPNLFYNYYNIILNSKSNVEVINILKKYNIKFLIFEKKPFYLNKDVIEKECFKKLYDKNNILLYEFTC